MILGIETSCDECSASVVELDVSQKFKVLSLSTFSQIQLHQPFGGVVPEVASRNHLETINYVIDHALKTAGIQADSQGMKKIEAIAVTNRPGLVGALLVGVSAAKAMAYGLNKPLIPVHHLEGHIASVFVENEQISGLNSLALPLLLMIASGGHTNLYVIQDSPKDWPRDLLQKSLIGRSRDDAAGEAFDKTAKTLGLPYPGGVWIDKVAMKGDPKAFLLPRALSQSTTFDFSFSGLKTAVVQLSAKLKQQGELDRRLPDLCASIQEAIVDMLFSKVQLAASRYQCKSLAIVGGVAANSRLRIRLDEYWPALDLAQAPLFPKKDFCTDNAAMIAAAGAIRYQQGHYMTRDQYLTLNAIANPLE